MSKSDDGAFVISFSEPQADGQWGMTTAYRPAGPVEDVYHQREDNLRRIESDIQHNYLIPVYVYGANGKLEQVRIPAGTITRVGLTEETGIAKEILRLQGE